METVELALKMTHLMFFVRFVSHEIRILRAGRQQLTPDMLTVSDVFTPEILGAFAACFLLW